MEFIVRIIVASIVRAITYAVIYSISTTIRNSIRNSISKGMITRLEKFVGADGEINEERISSLIKVNVHALGSGLFNVKIDEDVFDVLHLEIVTTNDQQRLFRLIQKEITIQKLKAKMKKDEERIHIFEALASGFSEG